MASVARPGGNVTGMSNQGNEGNARLMQYLKETVPQLSRLALIFNPDNAVSAAAVRQESEPTARRLGIALVPLEVRRSEDLDGALARVLSERASAVFPHMEVLCLRENGMRVMDCAVRNRLPLIAGDRWNAEAGALMTFETVPGDDIRRIIPDVDKILKGARPADLPVEQPTTFELAVTLKTAVLNLRIAKALSITFPPALLARADRVLE